MKPFYVYVRQVVRANGQTAEEFALTAPFMHMSNGWSRVEVVEAKPMRAKLDDLKIRIRGLAHDAQRGIAIALQSEPEHEAFATSPEKQWLDETRASIKRLTNLRRPMRRRPLGRRKP